MIWLSGHWLDGQSTMSRPGVLGVDRDGKLFRDVRRGACGRWHQVTLSQKLGSVPRTLALANGWRFICDDDAGLDALIESLGEERSGWLHRLESSWRSVAAGLLLLLGFGWGLYQYGVPSLASYVATQVPDSALDSSSRQLLNALPGEASQLSTERQQRIHRAFEQLLRVNGLDPADYRLHLQHQPHQPANAFALPSGDIVLLDGLVLLAEQDDEWLGVLAHEVAHVELRHGLRGMLQMAIGSMAITMVSGDMTAATGVLLEFPRWLTEQGYSRDFEREADELGIELMRNAGYRPEALAAMLEKLAPADGKEISPLFSSHPGRQERIRRLRELN